MNTQLLQEYALLLARKQAIDARLAEIAPELSANPAAVGTEIALRSDRGDYGTAKVIEQSKRYSRRYGDADAQALRDHLPKDLFEQFFVNRDPRVEVNKTLVDKLVKSDNPEVMSRRDEFVELLATLDATHRQQWEVDNPTTYRLEVTPSESLVKDEAKTLQAEIAVELASDQPRLQVEHPQRKVEVLAASDDSAFGE